MRLPNSGFVGGIDDLKGFYYDCSSYKQADRFVTTSKEINDYVGKNYSNGGDVRHTLENGELMDIPNPTDPSENFMDEVDDDGNIVRTAMEQVAYVDKKVYDSEIIAVVKRRNTLTSNLQKAYSLILGQCTPLMKDKLKASPRWEAIKTAQDALELMAEIKTISFKFEDQKFLPLSIHNAKSTFYSFRQGSLNNSDYFQRFKNYAEIATSFEGNLHDEAISKMVCKEERDHEDLQALSDDGKEEIDEKASQVYLSTAFLQQSDPRRYTKLNEDLENDYTKGNDNYPREVTKAYQLLNDYKDASGRREAQAHGVSQLAFAQQESGKDERYCFGCGRKNCTIRTCPVCSKNKKTGAKPPSNNPPKNFKNSSKKPGRPRRASRPRKGNRGQQRVSFAQQDSNQESQQQQQETDGNNTSDLGFVQVGETSPISKLSDDFDLSFMQKGFPSYAIDTIDVPIDCQCPECDHWGPYNEICRNCKKAEYEKLADRDYSSDSTESYDDITARMFK